MNKPIKTIEINVVGRVQGVYFRQSAAAFAQTLRLNGTAENLRDGSVKIIAQGVESSLEEFLKWCQRGSLLAKVEGMNYKWIETDVQYSEFKVLRSGSLIRDQVKSFFNLGRKIKRDLIKFDSNVKIPKHIVIIANGNRTWAKQRGLKSWEGYWHVQKKIDQLIDAAKEFKVDHFTIWGFSTENWKRSQDEVEQLMKVFESTLDKFADKFKNEKVQFRHLGRKDRLPANLVEKIMKMEESTKQFAGRSINVAFDYGGRDEILRAIDNIIKSGKKSISEEEFSQMLDTSGLPDPDLIIRNSGEKRLSGMMPWQSVYAEYYFTDVYFPDFGVEHLKEAIEEFSARKRTFGGSVDLNKENQENLGELNVKV